MRRIVAIMCSAAIVLAAAGTGTASSGTGLVPAQLQEKTDSQGFRWDVERTGKINSGTNYVYSGAMWLQVNGNTFQSQQQMMKSDGSEYVFTSVANNNIEVTRRVKVDTRECGVRYVESFKNTGSSAATVAFSIGLQLNSRAQNVVTSSGTAGSVLGPKDVGIAIFPRQGNNYPATFLCLARAKSKIKPAVTNQSNYSFSFQYSLPVPAGKTVSVVHTIAQRNLMAPPDAKTMAKLFNPFLSRKWVRDVPGDIRRTFVNYRGGYFSAGGGGPVISFEELGVERGASDVLAMGDETRIHGTATCSEISVETVFGRKAVPLETIAAIVGKGSNLGKSRIYLRDGQIFSGTLELKDLKLSMSSGLVIQLRAESLGMLVMKESPEDLKPLPEVRAFVETFEGDRLAITGEISPLLRVTTPWGSRDVGIETMRWLSSGEGKPRRLVSMRDLSRFHAFLEEAGVSVPTLSFGSQKMQTNDIRSFTCVETRGPKDDDDDEVIQPHVVLGGGNLLIGRLDLSVLEFSIMNETVPVPPDQIKIMQNLSAEEGDGDVTKNPIFQSELWGGDTITGSLKKMVLPVRTGGGVWQVPVADVMILRVPSPTVPESLRDKIALLIRALGHPDWQKRREATDELARLGYMAKSQMEEAKRQTTDAEVKRRLEDLINGLDK